MIVSGKTIQLITRGDDAGSSRSANRAIRQCCEEGILRNVSVMVPGPAFDDAVRVLHDLQGVDVGLHICLNSEWDTPRWSSVLPREQVPSLLDDSGMFTQTPAVLEERGFSVEEALSEITAQLNKVRSAGLPISYIDEHMGVSWIHHDLRAGIAELAQREGLVDAHGFSYLRGINISATDGAQQLMAKLASVDGGAHVLITHPMFVDEEATRFSGGEHSGGQIAHARDNDRKILVSQSLIAFICDNGIELKRYSDVLD